MAILVLKTGDETLRVREEDFGCTIWSRDKYAEGDETAFDVLRRLSEGNSIQEIAETLSKKHDVPMTQIYTDLISMFQEFSKAGWFQEELRVLEERL